MPPLTGRSKLPLERVFVVTGSGISAESGIPTFRGKEGYWRNLDPTKLATPTAFANDPELVWDWYRHRRELIRRSKPNAAHAALVKLAANAREFLLLTQNVDDLHARAQWSSQSLPADQLVQIHGDIFVTRCAECDFRRSDPDRDEAGVPKCPRCGGAMRPGVVWFGEQLGASDIRRVEHYLQSGPCDVVIVVGTTAIFGYIINWAIAARGDHGQMFEINPAESAISSYATRIFREPAAKALPRVVDDLLGRGEE